MFGMEKHTCGVIWKSSKKWLESLGGKIGKEEALVLTKNDLGRVVHRATSAGGEKRGLHLVVSSKECSSSHLNRTYF